MAHEIVPFISDVVRELVYDLSSLLDSIFWVYRKSSCQLVSWMNLQVIQLKLGEW